MASKSLNHLRIENICFIGVDNSILPDNLMPIIDLFRFFIHYQSSLYLCYTKAYPILAMFRIFR